MLNYQLCQTSILTKVILYYFVVWICIYLKLAGSVHISCSDFLIMYSSWCIDLYTCSYVIFLYTIEWEIFGLRSKKELKVFVVQNWTLCVTTIADLADLGYNQKLGPVKISSKRWNISAQKILSYGSSFTKQTEALRSMSGSPLQLCIAHHRL